MKKSCDLRLATFRIKVEESVYFLVYNFGYLHNSPKRLAIIMFWTVYNLIFIYETNFENYVILFT